MSFFVSFRSALTPVFLGASSALTLAMGVASAMGLAACESGAQCALDSDCQLGLRCNSEHRCVPRGGGDLDAALERDSGLRGDGGPDAPLAADAFVSLDAFAPDANSDAFEVCPELLEMYRVDRSSVACASEATQVRFTRLTDTCGYQVGSDRLGDVEGVLTNTPGVGLGGGLAFPGGVRSCTLELVGGEAVVIVCGACTIDLLPPT